MLPEKRFEFESVAVVPPYFPEAIPWDLIGTMTSKVLKKQFDWELGIHTTYLIGCCLTVAARNSLNVTPPVFSSACPDTCIDEVCNDIADKLQAISDAHRTDTDPATAGYAAVSIDPNTLFALIQLAIQIFGMIGRKKS